MAAILITDCTVTTEAALAGVMLIKVVTPATADDADTVDVSTVCSTTIYSSWVLGATDKLLPATSVTAAGVVTIPGSTDNEARTIYVLCTGGGL